MNIVRALGPSSKMAVAAIVIASFRPEATFAENTSPIVVELFTSQGCAACPAANEFFAEIASQRNVVAMSFHVDYWNYLGWIDPFSSKKATYRQKLYAMSFRQTGVFTPQIVIQGRRGEVGSDRAAVTRAIQDLRKVPLPVSVVITARGLEGVHVAVGSAVDAKDAEIWLYLMTKQTTTQIARGENQGKTLSSRNVVRELRKVGEHTGVAFEADLNTVGDTGERRNVAVVLVQRPKGGVILGAGILYRDR